MLLNYLADPVVDDWRRLAHSAVAGAMSGLAPETGDGVAAFKGSTMNGTRFDASLSTASAAGANAEVWTVRLVLDDDEDAVHDTDHRDRWRDWLHWAKRAPVPRQRRLSGTDHDDEHRADVAVDLQAAGPTEPGTGER